MVGTRQKSKRALLKGTCIALVASLSLSACADFTNQKVLDDADANPDSNESFNRAMYSVHNAVDTVLLRPVATGYRFVMPEKGREMVSNFVHNLGSPVFFANSVLQGDVNNSFATFWRFVVNTTMGVGGLFDVASSAGLKARDADFGQTMAVWGVPSGSYVFVPVMGPGTMRDSFGRVVDFMWNPSFWARDNGWTYAQTAITIVDKRSQVYTLVDDVNRTSVDPYATFRSGYLQKRVSEIRTALAVHSTPAATKPAK